MKVSENISPVSVAEEKVQDRSISKISVRDLNAYFGSVRVLKNISIDIHENKVLAIIGPSGCGKSTFLRSLNRMHEVVGGTISGKILLDGDDIMPLNPVYLRRKVGMIFQKPNPFPTMSVFN
ncbi:MAG: ATP-binding cassette domain-containing protein, partial [Ignavibacteriaceae bacterium]